MAEPPVASVAQAIVLIDGTTVNIALRSAQRALHSPNGDGQWVVTAIGGARHGARARSVRGSAATIHPYRVMRDHPPVDEPDPMVTQLPRSARIISERE